MKAKRVDLVSNKKLMKTLKSTQVKTVTHHLKMKQKQNTYVSEAAKMMSSV